MRRFLPPLILGVVVFLALSLIRWLLQPAPPPPPEPVVLAFPDMLGCWELDATDWIFGAVSNGTGDPSPSPPDSASVSLLVPPDRVILLPDSIDEWRRSYTTYRASPVSGSHDPRLEDYLRWFVRADTLWLVWSDRKVRAGLALLAAGDRLEGGGRAFVEPMEPAGERIDGRISVAAWKVNCATGLRDVERHGPRP